MTRATIRNNTKSALTADSKSFSKRTMRSDGDWKDSDSMETQTSGSSSCTLFHSNEDETSGRKSFQFEDVKRYLTIRSVINGVKDLINGVSIEPLMFLQMIGYAFVSVVSQNLYIDHICRVNLNYSEELCQNRTAYEDSPIETEIQVVATVYKTYQSIVEAFFPVLFALFLGPWSDTHGTKFPLLMSLSGFCVSSILFALASTIRNLPPIYFLICSIPISLTGGLVALLMSAFTYISTMSSTANRSMRIALLEGCWMLGSPVGFQASAKIFDYYGFVPVFVLSATFYGLAFLCGVYAVKDPLFKSMNSGHVTCRSIIVDMFDVAHVKETVSVVTKPRTEPNRRWLILLIIAIFLRMISIFGINQVMYFYSRVKFQWNTDDFSQFSTVDILLSLFGGLITLIIMKIANISDAKIGIFSALGFVVSNFIFSIAWSGWVMIFGLVIQMFGGLISIVIRSMISKCVDKHEYAKAFSFVSIGEACMPIVSGILFNKLYRDTVSTYPGAVYLLSSVLHFFIFVCFLYFNKSSKKNPLLTFEVYEGEPP